MSSNGLGINIDQKDRLSLSGHCRRDPRTEQGGMVSHAHARRVRFGRRRRENLLPVHGFISSTEWPDLQFVGSVPQSMAFYAIRCRSSPHVLVWSPRWRKVRHRRGHSILVANDPDRYFAQATTSLLSYFITLPQPAFLRIGMVQR